MAIARLQLAEILAQQSGHTTDAHGRAVLAWADCLLRAESPSPRRVAACLNELRTIFEIEI